MSHLTVDDSILIVVNYKKGASAWKHRSLRQGKEMTEIKQKNKLKYILHYLISVFIYYPVCKDQFPNATYYFNIFPVVMIHLALVVVLSLCFAVGISF